MKSALQIADEFLSKWDGKECEPKELAKVLEEVRNQALDEAQKICERETSGKVCLDQYHDDCWCPTCAVMQDEAGALAQQIRALIKAGKRP